MIKKKSQAALEFIMTYGWAILVVLVAIGALTYFGVLSPDRFLPAKCTLQSGIACLDHKATSAALSVVMQNSLGFDLTITDLKGEVVAWSSAGSMGFKGTKKSTPYAANLVAKDCTEKAKKYNLTNIKIVVKGIGPGREAAMRGLAATGLNIMSIMDATPIAHNGVRKKKPRRV